MSDCSGWRQTLEAGVKRGEVRRDRRGAEKRERRHLETLNTARRSVLTKETWRGIINTESNDLLAPVIKVALAGIG